MIYAISERVYKGIPRRYVFRLVKNKCYEICDPKMSDIVPKVTGATLAYTSIHKGQLQHALNMASVELYEDPDNIYIQNLITYIQLVLNEYRNNKEYYHVYIPDDSYIDNGNDRFKYNWEMNL